MEDNQVIEAIIKGDNKGYEVLFKRHKRKVYNYLKQRIINVCDVEDLTLITFEKAFEKLDTWQPTKAKFSTYLIQIAKYAMIDLIKAQAIRINGTDEIDKFTFIKDVSYTPHQILIEKELKALIEGRIDRMPKKTAPVMKLHFEGYSDEEIVEKLNMMHGNVRCILSRGRDKLKTLLSNTLYEDNNIIYHATA